MKCRIVSAMVLLAAVLPSWAFDDGDWQFWTTDAIEYKFTNQWTGRLEGECYFGDLYCMLQSTKSDDDWTDANILGANLTLSI